MPESRVEFRYTAGDVTSAQRARFLRSGQFRVVLLMWLVTTVFLILPVLAPNVFTYLPGATWTSAGKVIGIYLIVVLAMLYLTPLLGYAFNRFWHMPLELTFTEKQLRLSRPGKTKGLNLAWEDIRRVDETPRVFIITYTGDQKFIIIPKSAFKKAGAEDRLRGLIAKKTKPSKA